MASSHRSRRLRSEPDSTATIDLYNWLAPRARRRGRPVKSDQVSWTVTDDWPEEIPVTEAELDVFEAWFGDLFDELFGPRH